MSFGVKKCGIMVVKGEVPREAFTLAGEVVPVVEEYTYLGVKLVDSWELD